MGTIRAFFAILTLVAVAMLPGPSHALAAAVESVTHSHHHAGAAAHHHKAVAENVHHHGHGSCKSCLIACCAPAIAAVETFPVEAIEGLHQRAGRPAEDRERPDAARSRALRPPSPVA